MQNVRLKLLTGVTQGLPGLEPVTRGQCGSARSPVRIRSPRFCRALPALQATALGKTAVPRQLGLGAGVSLSAMSPCLGEPGA